LNVFKRQDLWGFGVYDQRLRVWDLVFKVEGLGFEVQDYRFRVEGLGFKVEGRRSRVEK
jgi:hypothetical protein